MKQQRPFYTEGTNKTRCRLLTLMILGSSSVALAFIYTLPATTHRRLPKESTPLPNLTTPPDIPDLPNLGNGSCPSDLELIADEYIKRWDDRVARNLRASTAVLRKEGAWHTVNEDLHLYSAYLDKQRDSRVRIPGILACNSSTCPQLLHPLTCVYKTAQGIQATVAAEVKLLDEIGPGDLFWPAYVICPFPTGWPTPVASEDLLVTVREAYNNSRGKFWIKVTQAPTSSNSKCCSVCVRPVFGPSAMLRKVAEFVAHYRVIGARHIFLYDVSMHDDLRALLARFQSAGIDVTVMDFKFPVNDTLMHSGYAHMTALHDCLWRSVAKTEWYLHVDFDELIMPLLFPSLPAIVNDTERTSPSVASVVFRSSPHCREYGASTSVMRKGGIPLFTRLYPLYSGPGSRGFTAKYMARARSVDLAWVHAITSFVNDTTEKVLGEQEGMVNHYRRCCEWGGHNFKTVFDVDLWNASALLRDNAALAFAELAEEDVAWSLYVKESRER